MKTLTGPQIKWMADKLASEEQPDTRPLVQSDIEGRPSEIIRRLAGRILPATNGWGNGEVIGVWKLRHANEDGPHVRLLLACPNANNPVQLFNEDARDYLRTQ
jgi:hypothetical protein